MFIKIAPRSIHLIDEFGSLDGLIQGWQDGLPGMKVGETRLLVIPGALGYGPNPPSGSGIEPDETLVFVITLKDVIAS